MFFSFEIQTIFHVATTNHQTAGNVCERFKESRTVIEE